MVTIIDATKEKKGVWTLATKIAKTVFFTATDVRWPGYPTNKEYISQLLFKDKSDNIVGWKNGQSYVEWFIGNTSGLEFENFTPVDVEIKILKESD